MSTLAEQFVLDVSGVTDSLVSGVLDHLSPSECYAFVTALWAIEVFEKICLVFEIEPPPTLIGVTLIER